MPGGRFGKDNHDLGRNDYVYVTPDLDLAKDYALTCKGRGRAKVVEVMPHSPVEVDDSTINGEEQESYMCDAATVVRVVWVESVSKNP